MRKILFFVISIFIFGCQNQNQSSLKPVTENLQIFNDSLNTMSFKAPEDSFVQDGFYTFSSKETNAKVSLEKLVSEDLGSVFSKEELIDKYKKGLNNVIVESKDDWFIVKGLDSKNNIVKIKGVYSYVDRLLSKGENPEGDKNYILLVSKAGILKIEYPKNIDEKMGSISKRILDSFTVNYDNF
jgi:hypothetical protein